MRMSQKFCNILVVREDLRYTYEVTEVVQAVKGTVVVECIVVVGIASPYV